MKNYDFYPPIEPFKSYMLPVSNIHSIYVEECGNPNGEPIIFTWWTRSRLWKKLGDF